MKFRATWNGDLAIRLPSITPLMLRLWLADHRDRLRAVSYNEYVRFIRQMFKLAVEARAITESPAKELSFLRPEPTQRITPTREQFRMIIEEVRSNRFTDHSADTANLLEFMGVMGLGQAECAALKGEHVDLRRMEIHIVRQKTKIPYVVPIFPQARQLLARLASKNWLRNGKAVFPSKDPKKALSAACLRLRFPLFSPRSLRRMFIVEALEKGVDPRLVARWQGHSDNGALILKTYGRHINIEHARSMAELLS